MPLLVTSTPCQPLRTTTDIYILGLLPILAPIFFSCPNSPHFQIYAHIRLVAFVTTHIRPPTSGLDSVSAYFLLNPRIQHICMAVDLYSPIILVYGPNSSYSRGHTWNTAFRSATAYNRPIRKFNLNIAYIHDTR